MENERDFSEKTVIRKHYASCSCLHGMETYLSVIHTFSTPPPWCRFYSPPNSQERLLAEKRLANVARRMKPWRATRSRICIHNGGEDSAHCLELNRELCRRRRLLFWILSSAIPIATLLSHYVPFFAQNFNRADWLSMEIIQNVNVRTSSFAGEHQLDIWRKLMRFNCLLVFQVFIALLSLQDDGFAANPTFIIRLNVKIHTFWPH